MFSTDAARIPGFLVAFLFMFRGNYVDVVARTPGQGQRERSLRQDALRWLRRRDGRWEMLSGCGRNQKSLISLDQKDEKMS